MMLGLSVDNHEARADGEGGKLIDRVAARAPVRELLLIEALGHTRVPFAAYQPDHRGGVELSAIARAARPSLCTPYVPASDVTVS
jgi:hypothetical protein